MNAHIIDAIDSSWTLFLDRDGVINVKKYNDYIKNVDEFKFCAGALEAFYMLENLFAYHIVVTNQQGIGKQLMSHEDVDEIHRYMIQAIEESKGHIDQIYYCADLEGLDSYFRKPNPGMAYSAKEDFPKIDFKKSVMVGDSPTDMEFGKKLGMTTVLVADLYSRADNNTDFVVKSLREFAQNLIQRDHNLLDEKFISKQ